MQRISDDVFFDGLASNLGLGLFRRYEGKIDLMGRAAFKGAAGGKDEQLDRPARRFCGGGLQSQPYSRERGKTQLIELFGHTHEGFLHLAHHFLNGGQLRLEGRIVTGASC